MARCFPSKPNYPRIDSRIANRILKEEGYYEIFQAYKKHLRERQ